MTKITNVTRKTGSILVIDLGKQKALGLLATTPKLARLVPQRRPACRPTAKPFVITPDDP